ncbi:MAG: hypothetical protein Q9222_007206 [Ikaeria aurantiellina]
MSSFASRAFEITIDFHREVDDRARKLGSGIAGLSMLQQQLSIYEGVFKDHATSVKDSINAMQKEINREFVPVIQAAVAPAYSTCVYEAGPGSFARMKAAMDAHLSERRFSMFQESVDKVQNQLLAMIKTHEQELGDRVDDVFLAIRRDYLSVLGAGEVPEGEILPKSQRILRAEVLGILDTVENAFRTVAGLPRSENESTETKEIKADTTNENGEKAIKGEPEDSQGIRNYAANSITVPQASDRPTDENHERASTVAPQWYRAATVETISNESTSSADASLLAYRDNTDDDEGSTSEGSAFD